MLTGEETVTLKACVAAGGHLFVEARPGWVDETGHAQGRVPGFGWDEMLGVPPGTVLNLKAEIPAQSARITRIEF